MILPDGWNLNHELVRLEAAWWLRKLSDAATLAKLETEARKAKLGLWTQENPIPPWDWREQQRQKSSQPQVDIKVVPNGVEIVALLPNPKGEDRGNEQVVIAKRTKAAVALDG